MKQKFSPLGLLLFLIVIITAISNVFFVSAETDTKSLSMTNAMPSNVMPITKEEQAIPLPPISFSTVTPHINHKKSVDEQKSTCTNNGYMTYSCIDCNETLCELSLATTPHTFKQMQTKDYVFRMCEHCYYLEILKIVISESSNETVPPTYEWTIFSTKNEKIATSIYAEMQKAGIDPLYNEDERYRITWNYLYEQIGNVYGVAGLMGNLYAESGIKPLNVQNAYERRSGYGDLTYTYAVDHEIYDNFVYDSAGYGIAQWTFSSRKQNLLNFANEKGTSVGNLQMQLEFLIHELETTYPGVLRTLKNATSLAQASNAVLFNFEAPLNQSWEIQQTRISHGWNFYYMFAAK